ncbi:MAG: PEP/pyruvate-binding domain-containing protein, partial [Acidimicrobiales bacterium]
MYVFRFSDQFAGDVGERRRLLGGKGAGLVEMTGDLGLPVPPGFVISTAAHAEYKARCSLDFLRDELVAAVCRLESTVGRGLGDPVNPLVVSVRSGAAVSMPGMMDTILNLGLTEATTMGLAASTNPAFANGCKRRFDQMFTDIVLAEVEPGSRSVPDQAWDQLGLAIEAVFRSWDSPRAVAYRGAEAIPDHLGTAVTVQAMVFGNAGEDSGTGVVFSRDPSTGENVLFGDYLPNAQGEDVVAGTHDTMPLSAMGTV